ncbi:MAG TPA: twin-arginine translocation signal domain-containing protein, partial [Chitinophagaceae bacterium]|nr:twin-arginine translocation signal domain-containing protein [Chitinophagaceae bacterium]
MQPKFGSEDNTRRSFLKKTAVATVIISTADLISPGSNHSDAQQKKPDQIPWYKSVTRWGQVNITEK